MDPQDASDEQFVQLIVSHQHSLRAFVMSLMPGHPDQEDVIQEAWALVWRKRQDFEPGTNFEAWIFTVARYKVMAHWQTVRRRKEQVLPEEAVTRLLEHAQEEGLGSFDDDQRFLRECLQGLRPEHRALVLRRYLGGVTLKQLAADIGRGSDSLKVTLHRIRTILRECILRKTRQQEAIS